MAPAGWSPPIIRPSPWSGWPAEWPTPNWGNHVDVLTDTAWTCVDLNASVMSIMPPYLVGAAPSLSADWLTNPDPDHVRVVDRVRQAAVVGLPVG